MALPPSTALNPGTVIAGRFILESHAGRGGMGSVFRARDQATGQAVALKFMHPTESQDALRRFAREAELLAELRHPGIVTYVAHGVSEGDQPFLAMEWLEGESLAQRLARQPLDLAETLRMARRIAESLATAHQRGVIHRDLKPSNLFLRHGHAEDVVLLDFGLARRLEPSQLLTGDGALLGTPGYMAPEQASSSGALSPATDVFSLGCVLYECLTGQPPFMAPGLAAVLAKILFAEPPPLDSVRKDLPASWQRLMDGMLAKDPQRRLPDAGSLQLALSVLEEGMPGGLPPPGVEEPPRAGLPSVEQQLVSVLLAAPPVPTAYAPTLTSSREARAQRELYDALRSELAVHAARVELLVDGSLLATFPPGRGAATDQATLAAHSALVLKERWPEARVVLATGRVLLGGRLLMGEVMDRVGELQRRLEQEPAAWSAPAMLDELTAGLLGPGFLLDPLGRGAFLLRGEHVSVDETRPLLGRPTPCVGRERELSMLELAFSACVEESSARAVLVTAPAGMGKSRLRHEFLRRLERQGQPVLVLQGRGDPLGAKAANGLLAQALRRLCSIQEEDARHVRQEKLAQRLSLHLAPEEAGEALEFLGELCGLSSPTDASPRLRAAREDRALMNARMGQALVCFLRAECAHAPVLLVLEDLHWADSLTVKLVDEALRELSECPLMVLALARPEVKTSYPGLWSRCLMELSLSALGKKAGARLVHEVLGTDVSPSVAERIVEQAAGNALFLEELIRAQREGRGESPPGTVLAMLQTRILRLEPEARQVLLAASFFGRAFWPGGVKALLGEGVAAEALPRWLKLLVELELFEPQSNSRFPPEAELRFRHALLREAAHELVPGSHKPTGHRLAGAWLEQAGESDPLVLAEHFWLGQEPERALHFYTQAVDLKLGMDLPKVFHSLEVAVTGSSSGPVRARLLALQALLYLWQGDPARTLETGRAVLPELKAGSKAWCQLLHTLLYASTMVQDPGLQAELYHQLFASDPEPDAVESYVTTLLFMATLAMAAGERPLAMTLLSRAEEVGAELLEREPLLRGMMCWARGWSAYFLEGRPWQARVWAQQAIQSLRTTGSGSDALMALMLDAITLMELGEMTTAVERLHEGQALARAMGRPLHMQYAEINMALLLAHSLDEAHREEARSLATTWLSTRAPNPSMTFMAHLALCRVAEAPHEAEAHGRKAYEMLGEMFLPYWQHRVRAPLCRRLLAQGRLSEARQLAMLGVRDLEKTGGRVLGSIEMHTALAEACFAEGDTDAGEASLRQALHCLRLHAEDIPDPAARERFLHQVPENARTLELARQRGLE